jgi:ABC-type multidrug transport system ATPase subunit
MNQLSKGHTMLAIAHRLSTVVQCNVIQLLEEGRIVESKNHAELLAKGGVYAGKHPSTCAVVPAGLFADAQGSALCSSYGQSKLRRKSWLWPWPQTRAMARPLRQLTR